MALGKIKKNIIGAGTKRSSDQSEDGSAKWLKGIADQESDLALIKQREEVEDYRVVPKHHVVINKTNARELDIDPAWLIENREVIEFGEQANLDDDAWFDRYLSNLKENIENANFLNDCINIATFAREIGKPENIMQAIVVFINDGKFNIISGERRFLCHFFWNEPVVSVKVWRERPTPLEFKILERQENHLREGLTSYEMFLSDAAVYEAALNESKNNKVTIRDFCSLIKINKSQAGKVVKLVECRASGDDYGLFESFKEGVIGVEAAYLLATLDKKTRKPCMDVIKTKTSVSLGALETMLEQDAKKPETKEKQVSPIKLVRKGNKDAVVFLLNEMVERLEDEALKNQIEEINLTNFKGVSAAMEALMSYIEDNKV